MWTLRIPRGPGPSLDARPPPDDGTPPRLSFLVCKAGMALCPSRGCWHNQQGDVWARAHRRDAGRGQPMATIVPFGSRPPAVILVPSS